MTVSPSEITSSKYTKHLDHRIPHKTRSISLSNVAGALHSPNGIIRNWTIFRETRLSRQLDHVCIQQWRLQRVPLDLGSAAPQYRWKEWVFGVRPWTPCDYTRMTLIAVYCIFVVIIISLWLPQCLGFTYQVVSSLTHLLLV